MQEAVAAEELVGALARQQHLHAARAGERGDLEHRHRALVHQRVLVVAHRLDEVGAPRRRRHRDGLQLDTEVARDAGRERMLVVGRLVGHRRVERHDARLLVARVRRDEARVDPAREERPDRHVGHQAAGDRAPQLLLDQVRQRAPRLALRARPAARGSTSSAGSNQRRSSARRASSRSTASSGSRQDALDARERRRAAVRPAVHDRVGDDVAAAHGAAHPAANSARISLANHRHPPWRAQYSGLTPQRSRASSRRAPLQRRAPPGRTGR